MVKGGLAILEEFLEPGVDLMGIELEFVAQ